VSTSAAAVSSVLFDVQDTDDHWLVARAKELKDGLVLVHYEWESRWDEWLPVYYAGFAPLNTHTEPTSPSESYSRIARPADVRRAEEKGEEEDRDEKEEKEEAACPLPSVSSSSYCPSAVLSLSLIQISAVEEHMEACPNHPKRHRRAV
jgi:hypothetical protein